ncbi:hypothetical protein [Actinacidiphila sp. ITFR-21]|uniref:hypothetical protein n=1 Tax=Actinacidiphila sp. ITFR-21 TaxID=3075199 RepID=UPI002888F951|nr:hypothetical protein [Streptomyces sp. ITFR-21]WNI19981.1 hypothetical protein RLT57_31055 [Streptomyces sp. ITFR-21]
MAADPVTDDETQYAISIALGDSADDYDIEALAVELRTRYGPVHIDDIPSDEFWAAVDRHSLPDDTDTDTAADRFTAEVTAAITADRPLGTPAVWRRGGVTVEITGASRLSESQRLRIAAVTITSTTGTTAEPRGLTITAELWPHVQPVLAEWEQAVHDRQETVRHTRRAAEQAAQAAWQAAQRAREAETALAKLWPDAATDTEGAAQAGWMSTQQVAAHLGIDPGSVRKQMSRWDIDTRYEPGPSGKAEARYSAAQIVARAGARPGRGVGGGRPRTRTEGTPPA